MLHNLFINHPWFIYLGLGLLSLCIGSLLNVVIYRLPLMLEREWKEQCYELLAIENKNNISTINLFFPRSFCPNCKSLVKSWQNIPLLSYILLGGTCYECKTPIPIRYPLIELFTTLISLYALWNFGLTTHLLFILPALWLLIPLFFIDLEHQILPDSLTLSLLWLGLIANTYSLFTDLTNAVLSASGAYLSLWFFIKFFYLITGKTGMGNGDFKLFAAFGAWFGWSSLPFIILLSSLCGALIGLIYLKISNQSRDTTIPFGPFLCISGVIYIFWGPAFIHWYLQFLAV